MGPNEKKGDDNKETPAPLEPLPPGNGQWPRYDPNDPQPAEYKDDNPWA